MTQDHSGAAHASAVGLPCAIAVGFIAAASILEAGTRDATGAWLEMVPDKIRTAPDVAGIQNGGRGGIPPFSEINNLRRDYLLNL